jgi:hypothetical protein
MQRVQLVWGAHHRTHDMHRLMQLQHSHKTTGVAWDLGRATAPLHHEIAGVWQRHCAHEGPRVDALLAVQEWDQGQLQLTATECCQLGFLKEHCYYDDYYGEGHEGRTIHEAGGPRARVRTTCENNEGRGHEGEGEGRKNDNEGQGGA